MIFFYRVLFLLLLLNLNVHNAFSDNTTKFNNLFEKIKKESNNFVNQSIHSFSKIINDIEETLDEEIINLKGVLDKKTQIDVKDKMDSIRLYLEDVNDLKKKETKASSFTIISKSKKDYRIEIDKVLRDIEPILFDGEIVNYATRIRSIRENIKNFENEKVKLNEKLIFAPKRVPY